jgi:hypothetical protein
LLNSERLPAQIKQVLAVKYAAKPFSQLSETEQYAHSIALLLKIKVVTGWPVPEAEENQNILAEQLKLYLIENWANYNVDEIMYAMRSYATVLNNWGKDMNLTLIGAAMAEYEKERSDITKLEESKAMKPMQTNLLAQEADWKGLCEAYFQDYLSGKFIFNIMPYQLYDEFVRCNMMAADTCEDFLSDAKKMLIKQLKIDLAEAGSDHEKTELQERLREIEANENELKIIQQAKKLAVKFLYKTAKERGFKNLFVKTKR